MANKSLSSVQTFGGSITFGTGVGAALGVNIGNAGAPVLFNGAGGTPSSINLTNATFPTLNQNTTGTAANATLAAGLSGSALTGAITNTGNATVLGSFTKAQLNTAVSDADLASSGANTDITSLTANTINAASFINFNLASVGKFGIGGSTNTSYQTLNFGTDNAFDIGASGANRARDLFLARNANIGGTLSVTSTSTLTGNVGVGKTPVVALDVVGASYVRAASGAAGSGYGIEIETNSSTPRLASVVNGVYVGGWEGSVTTNSFKNYASGIIRFGDNANPSAISLNTSTQAVSFGGAVTVTGTSTLTGITNTGALSSTTSSDVVATFTGTGSFPRIIFNQTGGGANLGFAFAFAGSNEWSMAAYGSTTVPDFVIQNENVGASIFIKNTTNRVTFGVAAAGGSLLSVAGNASIGSIYATSAPTNGLLVDGDMKGLSNIIFGTAGKGIQHQSGTGARAGNATLVAGTVTVTNTTVTANTLIHLTRKTSGGTVGTVITYTLSAGASFTINSDNPLDTSTFTYELQELN